MDPAWRLFGNRISEQDSDRRIAAYAGHLGRQSRLKFKFARSVGYRWSFEDCANTWQVSSALRCGLPSGEWGAYV